jgi:hypothetical protein
MAVIGVINSIEQQFPGPGISFLGAKTAAAWQSQTAAMTGDNNPHTVTLTFPSSVTLTRGKWRIKVFNFTGAATLIVRAYFSDGTNDVDVLLPLAAFTATDQSHANSGVDVNGEFCIDINATTFNVVYTLSANAGELDFEVFGQQ